MADKTTKEGLHECGHAIEAHGDEGCLKCECADDLGRATGVPPEDRIHATPDNGVA